MFRVIKQIEFDCKSGFFLNAHDSVVTGKSTNQFFVFYLMDQLNYYDQGTGAWKRFLIVGMVRCKNHFNCFYQAIK